MRKIHHIHNNKVKSKTKNKTKIKHKVRTGWYFTPDSLMPFRGPYTTLNDAGTAEATQANSVHTGVYVFTFLGEAPERGDGWVKFSVYNVQGVYTNTQYEYGHIYYKP